MKKMRIKATNVKFNGRTYCIEGDVFYEKESLWNRLKRKLKKEPKRFSF